MKLRLFTAIAFTAMAVISCNEETASIGKSLTDEDDKLQVTTGVYEAFSRSLLADSVYGQNFECYFGQIKDPETETYVKSEFMTQFNLLEGTTGIFSSILVKSDCSLIRRSATETVLRP